MFLLLSRWKNRFNVHPHVSPLMKCFCLALLLPVVAFAQNPPAAVPAANLLKNGNFESFTREDDLWDGVNGEGYLAGDASQNNFSYKAGVEKPAGIFLRQMVGQAAAVLEGGSLGYLSMPISVQVADLNKDGLLDILTLDGAGYFRVYFNSGTPTEPKFTQGEIVPLFLSRLWGGGIRDGSLKACLGDFDKSGKLDIVMGSYLGRLLMIKNTGSPLAPEWRQPQSGDAITIPTARDGHLWANLLAPAVADWNKDGKMDIVLGEGSYSANAVHLLLNEGKGFGTAALPQFNEDSRDYLAYGDGREQLIPAVVDYNGDGFPDLLVGDRLGHIWVYLSDGPYKKGVELKRQENPISFGGTTQAGSGNGAGCVFPAVADLNGDGKFDIIIGRANGHIAVSYNIGTRTEPKFGPLVELKGQDLYKPGTIRVPRGWVTEFGFDHGNFNGFYSIVTAEEDPASASATSKQVMKFAYHPVLNKVIRKPPLLFPGKSNAVPKALVGFRNNLPVYWGDRLLGEVDSNIAFILQGIDTGVLKPNTGYTLSFKVKGQGVKSGHMAFFFGGWLIRDLAKVSPKAVVPDNLIAEALQQEMDFNVTPNWTVVNKQLNFRFQQQNDLNDPAKWSKPGSKIEYRGYLDIRAALNVDEGVFYIDDVRLTPQ